MGCFVAVRGLKIPTAMAFCFLDFVINVLLFL